MFLSTKRLSDCVSILYNTLIPSQNHPGCLYASATSLNPTCTSVDVHINHQSTASAPSPYMHRITSATSVTSKHWSARRPTPHLAAERWRLSHVAAWANSCTCCNISSGPLHGARSRSDAPVLDEPPLVAVLTDGAIGRWVAAPRRGTPRAHASLASGMRAPTATKKRRRPTHAPGLACASKRDLLRRHRTRSVTRLCRWE